MASHTMIERVCRTLLKHDWPELDDATRTSREEAFWMFYKPKAHALLAAMRDPDDKMIASAEEEARRSGIHIREREICELFVIMIEAALSAE